VTGPHFLRTFTEVGRGVPLHATAVGKALLMGASEAEIRRLAANGLRRYTPNTIATEEALLAEIQHFREQGYSVDMEEYEPEARCLGAPIIGTDGKVICAISVAGPTIRLSLERIRALVPMITRSAADIAQALKFTTPHVS